MTLEDAKKYLRDNFSKGTKCPCCGQFVKQYKRKLNSGMARTLIAIYHKGYMGKPINVKSYLREKSLPNNHDWTLLKHWNLISEKSYTGTDKKSSGEWSITRQGILFVENKTRVPSHIFIYNTVFMGFEPVKTTSIIESLGKHFNYAELMK